MQRIAMRQLLAAPPGIRAALLMPTMRCSMSQQVYYSNSFLPVATKSFWQSMIPKPLRREKKTLDEMMIKRVKPKSKGWNPATFYIVIFLLIGSMSINLIGLKTDFATFMRQSEVRIGLLREVVEKLQKGESVDVEKMLGTGDPEKEQDWEELLKEIERDDVTRSHRKQEKSKQADAPSKSKQGPSNEEQPTSSSETTTKRPTGTANFF